MSEEPDALATEGWFNNRWRPAMAWQYFTVCLCDFIGFPVFTAVWYTKDQYHEWHPLTLQGGGLYHLAMGAIIGIATWQRTQEKLALYKQDITSGSITTEEHTKTSTVTTPTSDQTTIDTGKSTRAD